MLHVHLCTLTLSVLSAMACCEHFKMNLRKKEIQEVELSDMFAVEPIKIIMFCAREIQPPITWCMAQNTFPPTDNKFHIIIIFILRFYIFSVLFCFKIHIWSQVDAFRHQHRQLEQNRKKEKI